MLETDEDELEVTEDGEEDMLPLLVLTLATLDTPSPLTETVDNLCV